MSKLTKVFSMVMGIAMCLATVAFATGCGEEPTPEGFTEIRFIYDSGFSTDDYYKNLVRKYNETQGKTDMVYVRPELTIGSSENESDMVSGVGDVFMVAEGKFKDFAISGALVNLTDYLKEDTTGIYDESKIPERVANHFKITVDPSYQKHIAGEGQNVYALPFVNQPHALYYSKSAFENQKINIVSCEEEKLAATYPNLQPHGYAEYASEPFAGAVQSKNLAGQDVYKVFNNRIPMNWDEFRYLSKMFTKQTGSGAEVKGWNPSSPTTYGYVTEWWFEYGFSVGADCIGWDGTDYKFTLGDKTPNWLVTAKDGLVIGENTYACGDTLFYQDKAIVTEADGETLKAEYENKLYEFPSTYDAIMEFLRTTNPTTAQVDNGIYGYGVAYDDSSLIPNALMGGTVAMVSHSLTICETLVSGMRGNFDVAPVYQYREYEGGSVYYDGDETFANQYLKVIGKDGYEGKLKTSDGTANGTPIIGRASCFGGGPALAIASGTTQEKKDAAYKFVRWACGEEGQRELSKGGFTTPNQASVGYNDYAALTTYTGLPCDINYWAFAYTQEEAGQYDGTYFQNNEWISNPENGWSNDFNYRLRKGLMTMTDFLASNESNANSLLANMNIVIKGKK